MSSTSNARNCFAENTRLISSTSDPVQWNLNNGLLNLADAIATIQSEVRQLQHLVVDLQRSMPR